jgi:regulator of nucleoside diphosphate kinase
MKTPDIVVSTTDADRLEQLLDSVDANIAAADTLRQELDRARIVQPEQLPHNVVSMNSTVRFSFAGGKQSCLTLVYPKDMDQTGDKISILAPIGCALLGLASGDSIRWPLPSGDMSTITVHDVVYQPEREGAYYR